MMKSIFAAAAVAFTAMPALAQDGPVATACKNDLATYCAGKTHEDRQARTCLESNKSKVSADCKTALETTGGGKGPGMGKNAK